MKIVESHFKCEVMPTKIEPHLTNFIVYDLETHNTTRARPYCISFYLLSKLAGKYTTDLTPHETEKCEKDTLLLDGDSCVRNVLDFLLSFKGEERKIEIFSI